MADSFPAPPVSWISQILLSISHNIQTVLSNQEVMMTQATTLAAQLAQDVSDLQAEDGVVISALNSLAAKAAAEGSVSDADVQAAVSAVRTEINNLTTTVATDNPAPATPPAGP